MLTFKQYLNEVLNNPYKWELVRTSKYNIEYRFTTDSGIVYVVGLGRLGEDKTLTSKDWDLYFSISENSMKELGKDDSDTFKISGTGDQFRVFATVQDIVKDFIIKHDPDLIAFSAAEPSRRRLYSTFTANFEKSQPELFKTYIAWSMVTHLGRTLGIGADNFIMKREFAKKVLTLTPPTSYLYKIIPADYRDELR
jgi:hypothetical protein